jgi:hypothetical protein
MDTPDLIIPVRMDPKGATAGLQKVSAAGKRPRDDVAAGATRAGHSLDTMGGKASNAMEQMLRINQATIAFNAMKSVAGAVVQVLFDAADYARKMAADFVQLQKSMQGIAAITGQPNQNKFVMGEINKAESANLTPTDWKDFHEKYMAKTSMYIGDKEGSKLGGKESDQLEAATAEFAKGKGVSAGTMANMVGGMLAQEKGKTTAKDMIAKLGKVYAGLEASSTDPEMLMQGMTELMAAGFSAEDAAASIAQMPEIAPGQEATYLQRTTMELDQQQR